jgi:large subunit ribosomal protein L1
MAKLSKRMQHIQEEVEKATKDHPQLDAVSAFNLLKTLSTLKFVESVNVSIMLGVDPRKSDQVVRGAVSLPKGIGRTVRVAVLTRGDKTAEAKKAGADLVGFEDLIASMKEGKLDFDVLIATPDVMSEVGKLGAILGPRGLMPNPKVGTVTMDVGTAVVNAKHGQVRYRTDKSGIVHARIGNVQFSAEDLKENLKVLVKELRRAKPISSKGVYLQKITVSTTMGPGIIVDLTSVETAV